MRGERYEKIDMEQSQQGQLLARVTIEYCSVQLPNDYSRRPADPTFASIRVQRINMIGRTFCDTSFTTGSHALAGVSVGSPPGDRRRLFRANCAPHPGTWPSAGRR